MKRYMDASLSCEERAQALLAELSLEEKMAQIRGLMPVTMDPADCAEKLQHGIGQISTLIVREFPTLEDASAWQRAFQEAVMEQSEHHIPAVFHMEGVCGAFLQGALSLPSPIGRGASFDPETRAGRSDSRTMWTARTRRGTSSDTGCPIQHLPIQIFGFRIRSLRRTDQRMLHLP